MPKRFTLAIALGAALPAMAAPAPKPPVGTVRLPVLSYTVNSAGPTTGEHPKRSDTITVSYTLTLLDGSVVDSSLARGEPAVFPLNRLIPAWQILVQKMRPGDDWTFYVPPEYGYGSVAREKLPANSFLVFKVKLISFAPTPPE
ncbi:MAG TPA: FKBP-type peptidyl-prolyl cis-trans isomerase [Sphingomicrobium sp.]|jgi:peptidylprolyl isomerase/FKBP-type peptidyl-prolyl cis-trans isomerase FklB